MLSYWHILTLAQGQLSMNQQPNNPLHGVKLADIVEQLQETLGWKAMADAVPINCFKSNPTIKSALKFLRRTDWAREKVEALYLETFHPDFVPEKPKREPKFDKKPTHKPKAKVDSKSVWGNFE